MAADKLGGRVDHHIRPVLDGADQVRGAEGVVDHQRQPMSVGQGRDGIQVWDVAVGIAQGLQVDGFGVFLNGLLHLIQVMDIHKGSGNAVLGQCMGQQVVRAAIKGALGDNVLSCLGQRLDRVGDGGCAGGHRQGGGSPLQGSYPRLQHPLGGVGQSAVDVAWFLQMEPSRRVGGVVKDIGCGLINGHRPGVRGWVGRFLARMELQGFKAMERNMGHFASPLFVVSIWKDASRTMKKSGKTVSSRTERKGGFPTGQGRNAGMPNSLALCSVQEYSIRPQRKLVRSKALK